jgi:hypothetical protein
MHMSMYDPRSPYMPQSPYGNLLDPRLDPRLRHTDAALTVVFKSKPRKNEIKSAAEGRPIFDDEEICEIRIPGSPEVRHFPALAISADKWETDPFTGEQTQRTYAERFRMQYQQFKQQQTQTISGTPLDELLAITEARRAELRALNIYTVEQLASLDGQPLKNIGPYGRELKNKAQDYIDSGKARVADIAAQAREEAKDARIMTLEADLALLKQQRLAEGLDTEFDGMTDAAIRSFIETHTGHPVVGNPPRKRLVQMATEAKPKNES